MTETAAGVTTGAFVFAARQNRLGEMRKALQCTKFKTKKHGNVLSTIPVFVLQIDKLMVWIYNRNATGNRRQDRELNQPNVATKLVNFHQNITILEFHGFTNIKRGTRSLYSSR